VLKGKQERLEKDETLQQERCSLIRESISKTKSLGYQPAHYDYRVNMPYLRLNSYSIQGLEYK